MYGDIYAKWGALKWDLGELGFPTTDETSTPNGIGRFNHFEHGSIYWASDTGAHMLKGEIRSAWAAQGWEQSQLGFPFSDEEVTPGTGGQGRYQVFQGGEVFWIPQYGARIAIDDAIRVPVIMIKVSDHGGGNDAGTSFSDVTIRDFIDDTNAIYEPDVGIKLALQEITSIENTRINRLSDWEIVGCPEAEYKYPNPNPNLAAEGFRLSECQKEAYDYSANRYPDKIVVYIRRQTYNYDKENKVCFVEDEGGGGFSHKDLNFIALSSWSPTGTLGVMVYSGGPIYGQAPKGYLAHELGHYFDITHTMPNNWPQTPEEATQQLDDYCEADYTISGIKHPENVPDNLPDLVWNKDKLVDTLGDPGFDLYNRVLFNIDKDHKTATKNECIGSGEYKVYSNYCKREFTVRPARQNIMSYTAQCPYLPGNTTGETRARITPQQRDVILDSLNNTYCRNLGRVPYKYMWSGTLGKGWSHLMPFSTNPRFIAYNSTTGEVQFVEFHRPPDGISNISGYDILMKSTWGKGLSQLMPFTLNKKSHFIAYNSTTGTVSFDRIHDDGKGFDVLMKSTWGKGLSQLMPFTLNKKPHFIAYNSTTGKVSFDRIHDDGKDFDVLMNNTWGKGWSQLMSFTLNKKPRFIAYNSTTGKVSFNRIDEDGNGYVTYVTLKISNLRKGWTQLIPYRYYDREWKWMFIAHNATTGEVHFYQIHSDGKGVDIQWKENWAPHWSLLMPFYGSVAVDMGTYARIPYFITYTAKFGKVNFYRTSL